MITLKRAYAPAVPEDGRRFLIDRVWPRGRRREGLQRAAWLKEAGPSNDPVRQDRAWRTFKDLLRQGAKNLHQTVRGAVHVQNAGPA